MIGTFHFPIKKPDLNKQLNCFVNRINMKPTQKCFLFELHFEGYFINRAQKCKLNQQLNLVTTFTTVTTVLTELLLKSPSALSTPFIKNSDLLNISGKSGAKFSVIRI